MDKVIFLKIWKFHMGLKIRFEDFGLLFFAAFNFWQLPFFIYFFLLLQLREVHLDINMLIHHKHELEVFSYLLKFFCLVVAVMSMDT